MSKTQKFWHLIPLKPMIMIFSKIPADTLFLLYWPPASCEISEKLMRGLWNIFKDGQTTDGPWTRAITEDPYWSKIFHEKVKKRKKTHKLFIYQQYREKIYTYAISTTRNREEKSIHWKSDLGKKLLFNSPPDVKKQMDKKL